MRMQNKLREEFKKINGYDVYAYYEGEYMSSPMLIGFNQNYVEFLEKKYKKDIISAFENGRYNAYLDNSMQDITGEEYYEKEFNRRYI